MSKATGTSGSNLPAIISQSNLPAVINKSNLPAVINKSNLPAVVNKSNLPAVINKNNLPAVTKGSNLPAVIKGNNLPAIKNADASKAIVKISSFKKKMQKFGSFIKDHMTASLKVKDSFSDKIEEATAKSDSFKDGLKNIGKSIGQLGLDFTKSSFMMAVGLEESQGAINTAFGASASKINEWSTNALDQFGLGELQAKQFNGSMGMMLKTSGITGDQLVEMSTKIAGLSGDVASFKGIKPEESFEKLKSIVTGNIGPVQDLGLDFRDASMEAYALSKGNKKTYKEMSSAEQILLRYNYTMEKTSDMHGDFANNKDSFGNALSVAKIRFQELGASIVKDALPYATKILIWANDFMRTVPAIITKVKAKVMELWTTFHVGDKIDVLKTIFINIFAGIKSIIENAKTPFFAFVDSVKGFALTVWKDIAPVIQFLKDNIDFSAIWDKMKNSISGVLEIATSVFNFLNDNWRFIKPLIEGIAIAWGIYGAVMLAQQGITKIVTASQLVFNAAMNANPIGLIITAIGVLIGLGLLLYQNWDEIKAKAFELCEGIKLAFAPIGQFLSDMWEGVKQGFKGFINFIIIMINSFNDTLSWIPNKLSKIPGFEWAANFVIPKIPTFALGTSYFTGGLAHINERGGEIVDLPNGSKVIPADKSDRLLKNSGGHTFVFNFNGNVGTEEFFNQAGEHIVGKVQLALANM